MNGDLIRPFEDWEKLILKNKHGQKTSSWYHWRHLNISAGHGQRISMEMPGYGGSLFQFTSGVKI